MIEKITQSFIKDYRSYKAREECGKIIEEKYVHGREVVDPDAEPGAKELGSYFEFIAFGALPKDGKPPQPVMLTDGKKMDAKYRLATINAKRVRDYLADMGLKVIASGKKMTYGRFHGTLDLIVEFVGIRRGDELIEHYDFGNGIIWHIGDQFVIDLKYSGLTGESIPRYNKHGWGWSNLQKQYHGTQAKQYHLVANLPFYFLVTQSNNKEGTLSSIRLFHTPVSKLMLEHHIDEGNDLFDHFRAEAAIGFKAYPSLNKCSECPIREGCEFKHTFPHPEIVDLNTD